MQTDHATTHDALEDPRNADILIYINGALKPPRRGDRVGL